MFAICFGLSMPSTYLFLVVVIEKKMAEFIVCTFLNVIEQLEDCSGSVVESLTQDRGVAGTSF